MCSSLLHSVIVRLFRKYLRTTVLYHDQTSSSELLVIPMLRNGLGAVIRNDPSTLLWLSVR